MNRAFREHAPSWYLLGSGAQRDGHQLPDVGRTFDLAGIPDPTILVELVVRQDRVLLHVGHEREVHVKPFGARRVLFVANEPGRGALNAEREMEAPFEPGFFVELATSCFERGFTGLELSTDREPRGEALVLDEEHATVVAREDRN
jgi:hypothetical protein